MPRLCLCTCLKTQTSAAAQSISVVTEASSESRIVACRQHFLYRSCLLCVQPSPAPERHKAKVQTTRAVTEHWKSLTRAVIDQK